MEAKHSFSLDLGHLKCNGKKQLGKNPILKTPNPQLLGELLNGSQL